MTPGELDSRLTATGVFNLAGAHLPSFVFRLLSKGLKFAPKPALEDNDKTVFDAVDAFARSLRLRDQFGDSQRTVRPNTQPKSLFVHRNPSFRPLPGRPDTETFIALLLLRVRSILGADAQDAVLHDKTIRPSAALHPSVKNTLRWLEQNRLIVKPADKNLGTVIVTEQWYSNEVARQLNSDDYERCDSDHVINDIVPKLRQQVQALVKRWAANDVQLCSVADGKAIELDAENSTLPKFYLLIKVHKKPVVGRPIVASPRWVTTMLSRAVAVHLQQLPTPATVLTSSLQLVRWLRDAAPTAVHATPCCNLLLATFDVESLYTNLSANLISRAVRWWLQKHGWSTKRIGAFLSAIAFVLSANYFVFDKQVFRQCFGVAMGTNAAVHLANISLAFLEKDIVEQHMPVFYGRYVDDGLVIGTRECINAIKSALNACKKRLRFTFTEPSTSVEFLDLVVRRAESNSAAPFEHDVHQKQLNKYLYIPWASYQPRTVKQAFVKTELVRYLRNSSTPAAFQRVTTLFWHRLVARGYPTMFLRPVFDSIGYSDRERYIVARETVNNQARGPPTIIKLRRTPRNELVGRALTLTRRQATEEVQSRKPMVCWLRNSSLRDALVRAHFSASATSATS